MTISKQKAADDWAAFFVLETGKSSILTEPQQS